MEGYPNAAAKFSKEANLQPQQDISSIRARQEIQNCIHSGNIQSAIETLNDLDPEVSNNHYISSPATLDMIKSRVLHAPRIWADIRSVMINNHYFMTLTPHLEHFTYFFCFRPSY